MKQMKRININVVVNSIPYIIPVGVPARSYKKVWLTLNGYYIVLCNCQTSDMNKIGFLSCG
jgi:hypothetical protein